MGLFQNSVLRNQKQDEVLVARRWASFQDFLAKADAIKGFKEEIYQDGFLHDLFENCLGYTLKTTNPNNYSLDREQKNETDGKKADGAIVINSQVIGVIELKDQKSKNLDTIEAQAFGYHASHANSRYIIISNFDELRFYIDKKSYYEKFNLFSLNFDAFRKLHLLLSYESISSGLTNRLLEQSNRFEVDISKQLYRDFSDFRTHLFENMVKNNADKDKQTLLRLTQKLCDRLIFILFAEDRGLLRANTIKEIRQEFTNQKFTNYALYDIYKFYFDAISCGNERLDIPQYNGGLFARDELLDSLSIDDEYIDLKAQKLSDYDFMSDIGVNILGHIFEQSLTDLEELNAQITHTDFDKKKSKRKKDGVFYTPEYITRYIVENTLGKLCSDKKAELGITDIEAPKDSRKPTKKEQVTKDHLEVYRNWLSNLKILDPACGSGAFLNQALEFLIREHKSLQQDLVIMGDITAFYDIEESILEHNLYGVDINEDAVEIARLSLWLRTAQKGRMLTNLSSKIKCGNSLIDDKSVAQNAFVWEEEFPEVFKQGGFDVVIGNPPYGAQLSEEHKKYFYERFKTVEYQINTYTLFMEMLSFLTAPKGKVGYIVPATWLTQNYFKNLRHHLIENFAFDNLILFRYEVFENTTIGETSIFLAEHSLPNNEQNIMFCVANEVSEFDSLSFEGVKQSEWVQNYDKGFNLAFDTDQTAIIRQMEEGSVKLEDIAEIVNGIKPYETGKGTPKQTTEDVKSRVYDANYKIDESYRQYIVGGNIQKFKIIPDSTQWIKYGSNLAAPRNFDFSKQKIIVRQTSDIIISAVDYEGFLNFNNVHNVILKSQESISHEALSVILNSSLMDIYYTYLVPEKGRTFAEVKGVNLRKLPIRIPTKEQNETLTSFYNQMAKIKKTLSTLQSDFKLYLTTVLSVAKIPAKLDTPEKMSFDELQSALTKLKIDMKDFSIFRSIKQLYDEMMALQKEIDRVDGEIDKAMNKLYGLTSEEIAVVEGR